MTLLLQPVTSENWEAVARLEVKEDQLNEACRYLSRSMMMRPLREIR